MRFNIRLRSHSHIMLTAAATLACAYSPLAIVQAEAQATYGHDTDEPKYRHDHDEYHEAVERVGECVDRGRSVSLAICHPCHSSPRLRHSGPVRRPSVPSTNAVSPSVTGERRLAASL